MIPLKTCGLIIVNGLRVRKLVSLRIHSTLTERQSFAFMDFEMTQTRFLSWLKSGAYKYKVRKEVVCSG